MRAYSALLYLYPTSFRAEYGGEMRALFRQRRAQASGLGIIALWVDAIVDVVINAAGAHWDILRQDLSYTLRSLSRSPGFAFTAIVVTALGIGANTAAFSVADFVLIRPLPYADGDRLVKIWQSTDGAGRNEASPPIFHDWKASAHSFQKMAAYFSAAVNVVGDGEPQRVERTVVTIDLLPELGTQPIRGRIFSADEATASANGVILSYALWQSRFAGDERVLGRSLVLDGAPHTVIGVMPATFHFPNDRIALWTLMSPAQLSDDDRSNTYWEVLAKLETGVSEAQAQSEMDVISNRLRASYSKEMENTGARVIRLRDEYSTQSKTLLLALCGAALCVLLIACANLANLTLARALTRRRDLLVRSALGAGRERLVRQAVTESLVLAIAGGVLGIAIAVVAVPLLTRLVPTNLPIASSPTLDPRVLTFAAVITAFTGLTFGLVPAWRTASTRDLSGLRDGARSGGGRRERARSILVATEIAACVVLLVSAGLLMRALLKVEEVNPGFDAANVLTMRTALPSPKYDSTSHRIAFYRDVLEQVRAIPGVTSAAFISYLPIANGGGIWSAMPVGIAEPAPNRRRASSRYVTTGFYDALRVPLVRGRDVRDDDDLKHPNVAVVSESFAKRFWPSDNPLGKQFKFGPEIRTIVGVVGDVRVRGLERTSEPQVYMPAAQQQDGQSNFFYPKDLAIRSSVPMQTLVPTVREIVRRADPEQPISDIRMMSDVVGEATASRVVQVRVLGAFAAVAFLLAAVGIHGLLSFSVASRRHEIGVRMALGAQRSQIVAMIARQGGRLALTGVLPGIFIAYMAARALRSVLAGIEPSDAITFSAAAGLCVLMTLIGTLVPTMKAVRVDPATAFRAEV